MFRRRNKIFLGALVLICVVTFIFLATNLFSTPDNFPVNKTFLISEGESIKSVSNRLEAEGYVRSALLFRINLSRYNSDRKLQLGYYKFAKELSLSELVHSIIIDGPSFPYGKLTIPEGSTDKEIVFLIHKELPDLSVENLMLQIKKDEASGFLFPETYYLIPSMSEAQIISKMQAMFVKKLEGVFSTSLQPLNTKTKRTIIDTITLASILEGEANNKEDMKLVSGILQKRISIGMPLQVDVAPETYKEIGLPTQPINNPGLIAIEAAVNPTPSDHLFYITGKDGKMYYAKTFTEHKKNIQKYLR